MSQSPRTTYLPALLTAIEEAPVEDLRRCLSQLCRESPTNIKRTSELLIEAIEGLVELSPQKQCPSAAKSNPGNDAVQRLLQPAPDDRKSMSRNGELRWRHQTLEEEDNSSARSHEDDRSSRCGASSCGGDETDIEAEDARNASGARLTWGTSALNVDDIGPSGKCSSYAYSQNPRCAQRTDKAYIDALRAQLSNNPTQSNQRLINAEKKLKKDRAEAAFGQYMIAMESAPSKYEKCQNCNKKYADKWNDYESCDWRTGTLHPDYDGDWWPKSWSREDEDVDDTVLEDMIYTALKHNKGEFKEYFKWDCCQKDGYEDGCKMGRHIGPEEDPHQANRKRRRR